MQIVSGVEELRAEVAEWRRSAERIALVPTMGNLHAGHLALIRLAQEKATRCVVSIFVNPMQFGPGEDFDKYPRTLNADARQLLAEGVDLLFTPTVDTVYPGGQMVRTRVEVPEISDLFCGVRRPGHFVGVATVVCILFNIVQPDQAVFGEKDFQQLMVIRRMTADLAIPVEIIGMPTVREHDGLAMSSRNSYLTSQERTRAPALYQALQQAAQALSTGIALDQIERSSVDKLKKAGFEPDYFAIRNANNLGSPTLTDTDLVILAAAYLGTTRLIDNLHIQRKPSI